MVFIDIFLHSIYEFVGTALLDRFEFLVFEHILFIVVYDLKFYVITRHIRLVPSVILYSFDLYIIYHIVHINIKIILY